MNIVKVARTSKPALVAGAIAGMVRNGKDVQICAIGRTAILKACIAAAVARFYLQDEVAIAFIPRLLRVEVNGCSKTLMQLQIIRLKEEVL